MQYGYKSQKICCCKKSGLLWNGSGENEEMSLGVAVFRTLPLHPHQLVPISEFVAEFLK